MREGVAACDAAGLVPATMFGKFVTPFKINVFRACQGQDPELKQVLV